jgi:hypothetical protein
MVLRINPSKALLWRTPNEVQFGTAPDALKLQNLTAGQERLLALLSRGIADEYFDEVATAVGAEEHAQLLENLDGVLLKDAAKPAALSAEFIATRFAEICRAQAIHSREGAVILAARQSRTVFVQNNTLAHQPIMQSLERSAIGRLISEPIASHEPCDFAVLLNNNAIAPSDYVKWMMKGVAHISVVFDSTGVSISPVIETGKTPCLSCFHENRTAHDSAWPAIASQLLYSRQQFDDSVATLFAASIVCQRILQFCDQLADFEPAEANRTGYHLATDSGQISEVNWGFSNLCECRIA